MERRFSEVLGIDIEGAWEKVFDETLEMKGHQSKFQHIINRTFRRPRDLIKFCNSVLQVYKRRTSISQGQHKFTNEDINLARPEYSDYLRAEIIDEIHKYYPDHPIYFEMLRQIGYQQFSTDEFIKSYKVWEERLIERIQPMDILERLYEFSIIGFYKVGGRGYGGSEYIYKYLDQRAEFNRHAERFRVHWGLVETLQLKQYRVTS